MSTAALTPPALFDDVTVDRDVAAQRRMRRFALSGVLQFFRAKHGYSVEAAAVHAGVGHMTLRRVEDGQPVRTRTYRSVEQLLALPAGLLQRALGDDDAMVDLAQKVGIDTGDVERHRRTAAEWVEAFGEATIAASARISGPRGRSVLDHAGARDAVNAPTIIRNVGDVVTTIASWPDRSEAADAALQSLLRLMPELAQREATR